MTEHAIHLFTKEMTTALNAAGKDFGAHSIFSPSGSAMWATCPGSLVPNLFTKDSAGEGAAYGTVGHSVAEQWLVSGERPSHLIGTSVTIAEGDNQFVIEIDESMLDYVQMYTDWCIYLPGNHFVETRVDFSDLTPLKRQTGTADHAACTPGHLCISDLKMGKGVQVFAENNTQLVLYAYGFFRKYDCLFEFETITMRIAQPRLDHFDEWTITREELLTWADKLKTAAYRAWCKDAERVPSEKGCKWCRIKGECAAHALFVERLIDGAFDNLDGAISADDMGQLMQKLDDGSFELRPVGIGSLTVAQKATIVKYRKMVESWFAEIYSDLETRCINGETVPGYKLVAGKSNRVFTNNDDAAMLLSELGLAEDAIHPRGMITITAAESELLKVGHKRKELPDLLRPVVRKPQGKPSMAVESDRRPAIAATINDTFDNLDDEL